MFIWELGGGLFNGIWPVAVILWVSGSVIVNLTNGDRVLWVSPPFIVPEKNLIFIPNRYFFFHKFCFNIKNKIPKKKHIILENWTLVRAKFKTKLLIQAGSHNLFFVEKKGTF